MNKDVLVKVGKLVLPLITLGVSIASGVIADIQLDGKIKNGIAEALANKDKES